MQYTKITIEQCFNDGSTTTNAVEISEVDLNIAEYVNRLIRPVMITHTFHEDLVDEYIPKADEDSI